MTDAISARMARIITAMTAEITPPTTKAARARAISATAATTVVVIGKPVVVVGKPNVTSGMLVIKKGQSVVAYTANAAPESIAADTTPKNAIVPNIHSILTVGTPKTTDKIVAIRDIIVIYLPPHQLNCKRGRGVVW